MRDLRPRMFFSKVLFGTLLLSVAYSVSNILVPYTVAPGTVTDLNGSANRVDYASTWNTMWVYPEIVYYVGDAQCHQMSSRTIYLNGNEMPMDARMSSMYLWANFGLLAAMFAVPSTSIAQGIVNALPRRAQPWLRAHLGPTWTAAFVIGLGLLPVAVDGFVQLLTPYESTNVTRFLTGIPSGLAGGLVVGVLITSIRQVGIETHALRSRLTAHQRF